MKADRRAEIRWAIDNNGPVCTQEHKIESYDRIDHHMVWVKCGGMLLASMELVRTSQDQSDAIRYFVHKAMTDHEIAVLREIVRELLENP